MFDVTAYDGHVIAEGLTLREANRVARERHGHVRPRVIELATI
ncbi:MAG: hypothetical protein ACXVRH_10235 [Thermoleophilaceae bacterium]